MTNYTKIIFSILIFIIPLQSILAQAQDCCNPPFDEVQMPTDDENTHYVLKGPDVFGDGIHDDAPRIRALFKMGKNLVFPALEYLLLEPNEMGANRHFLKLDANNNNTIIYFKPGAKLIVSDDLEACQVPLRILEISPSDTDTDIENITIVNLEIDGNLDQESDAIVNCAHDIPLRNTGLGIYNPPPPMGQMCQDVTIEKIYLINPTVYDCSGSGIAVTGATKVYIQDAVTKNNRNQGIGISDNAKDGKGLEVNIYGHTSTGDAQSIDWSAIDKSIDGDVGKSIGCDLKSFNAIKPMKTAAIWDLTLKDVYIKDAQKTAFWDNETYENSKKHIENMTIENCGRWGLYLAGGCTEISNLNVINCGLGAINLKGLDPTAPKASLIINDLFITGQSNHLFRVSNWNIFLNNFLIEHNKESSSYYTLDVNNSNIKAENGNVISNGTHNCIFKGETQSQWNNVDFYNCDKFAIKTTQHEFNGEGQKHILTDFKVYSNSLNDIKCYDGSTCATCSSHNVQFHMVEAQMDEPQISPQCDNPDLILEPVNMECSTSTDCYNPSISSSEVYINYNSDICKFQVNSCGKEAVNQTIQHALNGDDGSIQLSFATHLEDCDINIEWNDGSKDQTLENLIPGEYCVDIIFGGEECDNCVFQKCFVIEGNTCPGKLEIALVEVTPTTCNENTGVILFDVESTDEACGENVQYAWDGGQIFGSIANLSAGVYCVTVTTENCPDCYLTKCFEILTDDPQYTPTVDGRPICRSGEFVSPGSIEVSDIPQGFSGYWLDDPTNLDPLRTGILIPGTYCYRIFNSENDCFEDVCYEVLEVFVDTPLDCIELQSDHTHNLKKSVNANTRNSTSGSKKDISVFPNPNSGILNIEGISSNDNATVYSLQGIKIISTQGKRNMDISSLETGLYILIVKDSNGDSIHQEKIIKL